MRRMNVKEGDVIFDRDVYYYIMNDPFDKNYKLLYSFSLDYAFVDYETTITLNKRLKLKTYILAFKWVK